MSAAKTITPERQRALRSTQETVRTMLKVLDITELELATRLGVEPSTVNRWVRGERVMSVMARTALATLKP